MDTTAIVSCRGGRPHRASRETEQGNEREEGVARNVAGVECLQTGGGDKGRGTCYVQGGLRPRSRNLVGCTAGYGTDGPLPPAKDQIRFLLGEVKDGHASPRNKKKDWPYFPQFHCKKDNLFKNMYLHSKKKKKEHTKCFRRGKRAVIDPSEGVKSGHLATAAHTPAGPSATFLTSG